MIPGGWTSYCPVSSREMAVFCEAMKGYAGASFAPFLVSAQVVAGTNYRFICNTTSATTPSRNYISMVTVFQPLCTAPDPRPVITGVCEMGCATSES